MSGSPGHSPGAPPLLEHRPTALDRPMRPFPIAAAHHLIGAALVLSSSAVAAAKDDAPRPTRSAAYVWLDVALEATAREHDRNTPRPTIGSRMLGIVVTCMYDAWAAYDDKA